MSVVHEPRVVYRDYDDMLADQQVEAIIIAVADQYHVSLARKAVDAGKHLLVEKPLGVNVEECEDLLHRIQNSGLTLQVGNNRRFDPAIAYARSFIKEEIGQILALKSWYYDSTDRYTMTDNLQPILVASVSAKRPQGNPKADKYRYFLLGHGSHLVDAARFLGGDIVSVHARFLERFGSYCWFVSVDFANGSLGHFDLIIAIRGDFEEGFQVFGEHGSVRGESTCRGTTSLVTLSVSPLGMVCFAVRWVQTPTPTSCKLRRLQTQYLMGRRRTVQVLRTASLLCGRWLRLPVRRKPAKRYG